MVKTRLAWFEKAREAAPLLGFPLFGRPSKHNSLSLYTQYLAPQNTIVAGLGRPSKHNSQR